MATIVAIAGLPSQSGATEPQTGAGPAPTAADAITDGVEANKNEAIGPWRVGATTPDGWKVESIRRHDEFVRVGFVRALAGKPPATTRLEIIARPVAGDPFSSSLHRVQPAPGESPDEDFVLGQVARLRAWEAEQSDEPLVAAPRDRSEARAASAASPSSGPPLRNPAEGPNSSRRHEVDRMTLLSPWLLGWALLPLLSLLLIAAYASRRADQRTTLVLASIGAVAIPAVATAALWSFQVPIDWVTTLHEGTTEFGIHRLYGSGIHAGPAHSSIVALLAPDGGPVLTQLAKLHALIAIANIVLFIAIVAHIQPSRWVTLLLAAELVANFSLLQAAFSEIPSSFCHFAILHGLIGWLMARNSGDVGWFRGLAWLQVCLATVMLAATRPELAIFGVAAMASALWEFTAAGTQRERWFGMAQAWTLNLLMLRRPRTFALLFVAWLVLWATVKSDEIYIDLPIKVLMPLPSDGQAWGIWLVTHFSLATVVLMAYGGVELWRGGARSAGLAVAAIALMRTYWVLGHNAGAHWEMLRYNTYWLPVQLLIATAGVRGFLRSAFVSKLTPAGRWLLVALIAGTIVGQGSDFATASAPRPTGGRGARKGGIFLALDSQLETRMWLRQLEMTPDCIIVAPIAATRTGLGDEDVKATPLAWLAFGGPLPTPQRLPDAPTLEQAIEAGLPKDTCVLRGQGIDCALVPTPSCPSSTGTPLQRIKASALPWTHRSHAPIDPHVILGIWPQRSAQAQPAGDRPEATARP